MSIKLGKNTYGKNAVNLSKIIRHPEYHEFRQISVNVLLEGDFETAHTVGDNSRILPTDTQKNTVYALAREHFTSSIEAFAIILCDHFKSTSAAVAKARIEITEHNWSRMDIDGKPHSHSFINGGLEKHFTAVTRNDSGIAISSGIKDLLILKTTDSGFEGYPKDKFTTLKETSDRIFGTQCDISWD